MFGFLKKKLKEAVDKVSDVLKSEEPKKEEPVIQEHKEEIKHSEKEFISEIKKEDILEEKPIFEEINEHITQKEDVAETTEEHKKEITVEEELRRELEQSPENSKKNSLRSQNVSEEIEETLCREVEKIEHIKETQELEEEVKETIIEEEKKIIELEHEIEEEKKEIKEERIEEIRKEAEDDVKEIIENEKELHGFDIKTEDVEIHLPTKHDDRIENEIREIHEILETELKEKPKEVKQIEKEDKGIFSVFKKVTEKKLSEDDIDKILKELNKALLENDVAFAVAEKICDDVKQDLINKTVSRGQVEKTITSSLRSSIIDVLTQNTIKLENAIDSYYNATKEPFTIMFLGFNGVGKTTTLAKFAKKMKEFNPIIAAADTFRAASIEQLEEHGRRIDFKVVKHDYGSDAAAVIFDAKKHASAIGSKLVLADTAGRSHANSNLMDELKKIVRVNKPNFKILVLDSLTGNDIYEQAKLFNEAVGVDGVILTKADVYEKGASLSAAYTIKKPILYFGVGQNYDDLKEFNPEEIADKILES